MLLPYLETLDENVILDLASQLKCHGISVNAVNSTKTGAGVRLTFAKDQSKEQTGNAMLDLELDLDMDTFDLCPALDPTAESAIAGWTGSTYGGPEVMDHIYWPDLSLDAGMLTDRDGTGEGGLTQSLLNEDTIHASNPWPNSTPRVGTSDTQIQRYHPYLPVTSLSGFPSE